MGTVGRLVGNAMGTECNYQLIYVDDLHVVVFGETQVPDLVDDAGSL